MVKLSNLLKTLKGEVVYMSKRNLKLIFMISSILSFIAMITLTIVALIDWQAVDIVSGLFVHVTIVAIFIVSTIGYIIINKR